MKFIMIRGTTGTGKSHFLSYIGQELLSLSKQNLGNGKTGYELFSGRGQHRLSSSPFQIWKSIIKSMLKGRSRASSNLEAIRKLKASSANYSSPTGREQLISPRHQLISPRQMLISPRQQLISPRSPLETPSKYFSSQNFIYHFNKGMDNMNSDVLNELPNELQDLKPLLNASIFHSHVFESNEVFESIPTHLRMEYTTNLLYHIIEIYTRRNPKNTVIFM